MSRLLGVGACGLACIWSAAASASQILTPAGPAAPEFRSLPATAPLPDVPAVASRPAIGFSVASASASASTAPATAALAGVALPARGVTIIQPDYGSGRVSIDGLIVRRPLGDAPVAASAVPEPGTVAAALIGIAAVALGRRMRAR